MTFDPKLPLELKKIQQWFAGVITQPIDGNSKIHPVSPDGLPIEVEAGYFIKPSPTLRPAQRIELYNQQYWWRLLSVLQENFPFLTRLFGYQDFNVAIAFPYLVKYPSNHWSLNILGNRLVRWIEEDYHASDKELISIATKLDWAYCYSFSARQAKPVSLQNLPVPGDIESLLEAKLYLQPHIHLFHFHADYFELRYQMIKESVEHWTESDFPKLETENKNYYYVLFRDLKRDLVWNVLSEAEYKLLSRFQTGASIEECCAWLEKQRTASFKDASSHIQQWFKRWVAWHWLTLENPKQGEQCTIKPKSKKKSSPRVKSLI